MALFIIPLGLAESNLFVQKMHRHQSSVRGCKFCIGVSDGEGQLRGVAIAGRPVSRHLDDRKTLEVTRCCTDGVQNGCSILYASIARIARQMGYEKIITYTLASESGTSLRASGWSCAGIRGGGKWSRASRPRTDNHPMEKKLLWQVH
jgi:hypothetical protein